MNFNIEEIRKNPDSVDWYSISCQPLSENFISEFKDKVNWTYISRYQKLTENFISEFKDKVNWDYISANQKLTEDFIREFKDNVYWSYISRYQKLTEDFIREFKDKVNWINISKYQKLTEDFIREFKLEIPKSSWMYKSTEEKREYIENNTEYKIQGDMVTAYKSCRSDGYSCFNFQYKYEVGGEYESTADYNEDAENSFGLSAWSKKGAREYYNRGKLLKVGVFLEDIACIVRGGEKIRAVRIKVLEEIDGI